jgi:hypothetical protein
MFTIRGSARGGLRSTSLGQSKKKLLELAVAAFAAELIQRNDWVCQQGVEAPTWPGTSRQGSPCQ